MIVLDIILDNEETSKKISSFLIKKKYAFQIHIDTNTILTTQGKKQTIRLFFITKALLFSAIESEVKRSFFRLI